MTTHPPFRKVFVGVATREEMFRLFNHHRYDPDVDPLSGKPYSGEWFEIGATQYHFMLGLLPPLFQRTGMFGLSEYKAGNVTSVFFAIRIRVNRRAKLTLDRRPILTPLSRTAVSARPGGAGRGCAARSGALVRLIGFSFESGS